MKYPVLDISNLMFSVHPQSIDKGYDLSSCQEPTFVDRIDTYSINNLNE
jgi:hypothetical protein